MKKLRRSWTELEAEIERENEEGRKQALTAFRRKPVPLTGSQLAARNALIVLGGIFLACFAGWAIVTLWFQIPLR
jgi:hypothetical protein